VTHSFTKPYIVTAFLVTLLIETANSYVNANLRAKYAISVQKSFYDRMLRASYRFVSSIHPNDIYYRMFADTSVLTSFAYDVFLTVPVSLITVVILSVVMFNWSWSLALFMNACIILQLALVQAFASPLRKATEKYRHDVFDHVI